MMMENNTDPFEQIVGKYNFPGKNERDTLNAIVHNLNTGIMAFCATPDFTVADYFRSILRSKGEKDGKSLSNPNTWSNQKLLGRIEKINDELMLCPPELWGNDEKDTFDYKSNQ